MCRTRNGDSEALLSDPGTTGPGPKAASVSTNPFRPGSVSKVSKETSVLTQQPKAVADLRPVLHVLENTFPATAVEPGDRMSLSVGIGGKGSASAPTSPPRKATGLSSILACHPVTLHGPVSRDYIPDTLSRTYWMPGLQLATVDFSRATKNGASGRWSIQRENTSRSRQYSEISASCSGKSGWLDTFPPVKRSIPLSRPLSISNIACLHLAMPFTAVGIARIRRQCPHRFVPCSVFDHLVYHGRLRLHLPPDAGPFDGRPTSNLPGCISANHRVHRRSRRRIGSFPKRINPRRKYRWS